MPFKQTWMCQKTKPFLMVCGFNPPKRNWKSLRQNMNNNEVWQVVLKHLVADLVDWLDTSTSVSHVHHKFVKRINQRALLFHQIAEKSPWQNSLSVEIVNKWNSLPSKIMQVPNLKMLKDGFWTALTLNITSGDVNCKSPFLTNGLQTISEEWVVDYLDT